MTRRFGSFAGITVIEVLIAVALVSVAVIGSMRLTVAVLEVMGRAVTGDMEAQDAKPARLRAVSASWVQAELEFIKQIGFDSACPPADESCVIWFPDQCGSVSIVPPVYTESPPLPAGLSYWRVTITYDANAPTVDGARILRLAEVGVFRNDTDCNAGTPFVRAYTSLRRE